MRTDSGIFTSIRASTVPEPVPVYEDPSNGVKIMKVVPESGEKLVAVEIVTNGPGGEKRGEFALKVTGAE